MVNIGDILRLPGQKVKIYSGFFSEARDPRFKKLNFRVFDDALVKLDLLLQLNTRKGERDMDPEFGCIIWDILFENRDQTFIDLIKSDISKIVASDPRLNLLDMNLTMDDRTITVDLMLQIKPHNSVSELSFTFK